MASHVTSHHVELTCPYTPEQIYTLVMDVESYSEFIPWCRAARVLEQFDDHTMLAELVIAFKHIRESYVSRVTGDPDALTIDVNMERGPFKHLTNNWAFFATDNGCKIHFDIAFSFKSRLLEKVIGSLFNRASEKMVDAFMSRADVLYGNDDNSVTS